MSSPGRDRVDSLAVAQQVDTLCDRYEEALRRGTAGRLDDWLPAGAARGPALIELARLDLEHRRRAGETACAEDYFRRYPELRANAAAAARLNGAERHEGPTGLPTTAYRPPHPANPAALTLAAQFGRYRIVKVIGQGGMGTVYQAHDVQLDRPVALKAMRFGADEPDLVQRFYREARIAGSFTHPALCPVYDVGQLDGVHYLTMPLLGGETLSAYLEREGPLPEADAARLTALIARAVHDAHQAGVVHRDLKPANVMLNERRLPVVMDFGLARRFGPLDPRTTAPGALLGTPAYMAPEQINGGSDAGGPAQDVYSLGIMLYEMLTGRHPFEGPTTEMLLKAITTEPEPPSRYRPGLDPRLERVCLTALAKKPAARFPSMAAFAESLETYRQQGPTPPEPVPGRRRLAWLVLLVLGIAAVCGGVATLVAWPFLGYTASTPTPAATAPPTTQPQPPTTGDRWQAGSQWVGTFRWNGDNYDRKLVIDIKTRNGDRFRGTYDDDNGAYRWEIEGTIDGERVHWGFTKVLHENQPLEVVGNATVNGTLKGGRLTAAFHNDKKANGNTDAAITLTLKGSQ